MTLLLRTILLAGTLGLTGSAFAMEQVSFASRDGTLLTGWLAKPAGAGPFPAVVAMHGCGGLWTRSGKMNAREIDWSERLNAAGYAVLLPDSFRPRGISSLCNDRDRALTPTGRAKDAFGASDWLAQQPFIATGRNSLIGWSNGGSTVLRVAGDAASAGANGFRKVIAFYPDCRFLKRGWSAKVPTTILQGLADDWTPAAPCQELAQRGGAQFTGFSGAYHDFDHPDLPLRERNAAFSQRPDGKVTIGTNPEARQQAITAVMAILAAP
ncbi:dienelactone hydrolase family protein [Bosea sp. 685]|uniref:dienelactone hydrolase family protein n=1 Tax=Bosea sp. 685 TaxID=3080057 RepID=UPI002893200E|nr:dienelactone hydrolase family protein [Bosea sp. 685]WNJ89311.1 dienelactone hydrolase family protein [Bosea sp. 685]